MGPGEDNKAKKVSAQQVEIPGELEGILVGDQELEDKFGPPQKQGLVTACKASQGLL